MIPVLFKTSIKASPHPLPHHPPTPIIAPPLQPHILTHSNMCAAVTCEEFQIPPLAPYPYPLPPGSAPHTDIPIIFA